MQEPPTFSPRETYVRSQRILRAVERAGTHLTFDELVALVDRVPALADRPRIERHLAACPRCAHELHDLGRAAPVLAAPLRRGESPGTWPERMRAWFGDTRSLGAATAAVALAVAVAIVWQSGLLPGGAVDGGTVARMDDGGASARRGEYDRRVLDGLGSVSPAALSAYQANDFAQLAKTLTPLAAAGNARAQAALGLLYAEGLGVPADPVQALYWWLQAEGENEAARHNLDVLRARQAPDLRR